MKRGKRIGAVLLALCVFLQFGAVESLASGRESYTYTVTFHAGNHGVFPEGRYTEFLSVIGASGNVEGWQAERAADGRTITVSGIPAGAQVSYDAAAAGAVELTEGGRYYVLGVRRSGYDNAEVGNMLTVSRDLDYVAAYGVPGDMTNYRVNYEDEAGNTLAESRIYSGKVGDRPVAAYRYIEGYRPQAYNLTKTLSKNETENVFTFVYTRVRTGGGSGGGGGTAGDAGGGAAAGTPDAGTGTPGAGTGTGAAGAGTGTAGGAAAGGAGTAGEAGAQDGTAVPDTEVPADEGPRDLIDLDDEETPLADAPADAGAAEVPGGVMYGIPVLAALSLLLAAVLAWYAGRRYFLLHKEKDQDEEE